MKPATLIGIALIVVGIVGLAFGGITYVKDKDSVDLGPIDISVTEKETIPLRPVVSAAALAGGVLLIALGARKP